MIKIENLLEDAKDFVRKIIEALKKDGIKVSDLELDHLCFRTETREDYSYFKEKLFEIGRFISEVEIAGRPIALYKLSSPIIVDNREIYFIELPAPKKESSFLNGWEHAEFVIKDNFEDFMKKYPAVKFDLGDISKPTNPDIKIKYDGFCVKFHHKSLEEVRKCGE